MKRILPLTLLAVLATACTTLPPRIAGDAAQLAAQAAREQALSLETRWHMAGRLTVSADGDGGSGRIEWRQQGEDFEIRLSAPVTRQSWRLAWQDGEATLQGLEGGERRGANAEALLEEATGWRIPLQSLSSWARGGRSAGPGMIEFTPDGLPALITQHGWTVEYREWGDGEPQRPRRVFARRGEASVRLVVDTWEQP